MAAVKLDSVLVMPEGSDDFTKWDHLIGADPNLKNFADEVEIMLQVGKRYRVTVIVEDCPTWYPFNDPVVG